MNCPHCARQCGEIHEQHQEAGRVVTTRQDVCQCGWRAEPRELNERERLKLEKDDQAGAALNVSRTTVRLKDLPAATRRKVKAQLQARSGSSSA